MSNTPHELAEEFPGSAEKMSALKQPEAHFEKFFEQYHEINCAVHRAETNVEPTSDDQMTDIRKQRMVIKDQMEHSQNAAGHILGNLRDVGANSDLIRLWLSAAGDRLLPEVLKHRYGSIEIGARGGIITLATRLHAPLDA